ncbi:hypothetical protein DMX12_28020 [Pseudomonas sp. MB-090624]|nr:MULTISPECIES: hypothetical protein [Pseudomonas]PYB89878.1 hypothetical protein DMX12_28020 [Pseudomonas sp. MB-090624]
MDRNRRTPLLPDDPLYQEAVEALKRYHRAQMDERPADEVELLRMEAEQAFQQVADYQLEALGGPSPTRH